MDSLFYDLQCKPQDYWFPMLLITEVMEHANKKIRNFCPLRTSAIPHHITLDTTTLVHLLYSKDLGQKSRLHKKSELLRNKNFIWETFFKTDMKVFKARGYCFNYMINTDGIACSILLIRQDMFGRRILRQKCKVAQEPYIDELTTEQTDVFRKRTIVGIDPNMSDLLYCSNEDGSKQYRYTQNQRRQEAKVKKYRQIRLTNMHHTVVENRTIAEWESDISPCNQKTVDSDRFKAYIKVKLLVNSKVTSFYEISLYRKMRLSNFYSIRKSEQRLVQRFKEIFGNPSDVAIGIGDWEQKQHRKFKEPIKGKDFRTLLRKANYPMYLVDEHKTSCQCSHCQCEAAKCIKFRIRMDPNIKKPDQDRHLRLVHGLLLCQQCKRLWNQNVNSSINIARLTRSAIDGKQRPDYMSRQKRLPMADSAATSTA